MDSLSTLDGRRHEYPIRPSQQMANGIFGLLMIAATIPVVYLSRISAGGSALPLMAVGLLAGGSYLLAWALRTRLVLDGHEVRVRGVLSEETFDRSDIEGWRTIASRYGSYRVLMVRGRRRPIQLSRFATDAAFQEWFGSIPDLDERDRRALLGEIERSDELGATPEERLAAWRRSKAWNIGLAAVTIAAAGGLIFGEAGWKLPCATVLWLTPVAAVLLLQRSPLLYTVFRPKKDPRADLSVALMISGIGLMFNMEDANLVSWSPLLVWVGVAGVVYFAAFYHAAHSQVRAGNALIGLLVVAAFYSFGAAISADILADSSPATVQPVQVVRRYVHVTSGRGQHTSYFLVTEPWDAYGTTMDRVKVSSRRYRETRVGDVVCVGLHRGLLRAAWYAAVPCG